MKICDGDCEVMNCGISGNRVVDLLARWKRDCLNLKPDVITILIGVNDVWHEFGNHDGVSVPLSSRALSCCPRACLRLPPPSSRLRR